jgi:transposase-like protein
MSADEYKERFGLPWTRGLISAASLANSGWTNKRKARARSLARQSRFFELAHLAPRQKIDLRVRALADRGLSSRAIARALKVAHTTVLDRTKRWRKGDSKR